MNTTIVQLILEAKARTAGRRDDADTADAKREFALAITALEDALMRVNRGVAKEAGIFRGDDVEANLAAAQ